MKNYSFIYKPGASHSYTKQLDIEAEDLPRAAIWFAGYAKIRYPNYRLLRVVDNEHRIYTVSDIIKCLLECGNKILPVRCAWCNSLIGFKDGNGSTVGISDGICPTCSEAVKREFYGKGRILERRN